MSNPSPKDLFLQSLNRCTLSDAFVSSFYKRFLSSSEEIRNKFKKTDFERQNKLIIASLKLSANALTGDPYSLYELNERAESHDRHHLNIRPELYVFWREALITTAKEFDDQWNDQTENAWKTSLEYITSRISRQY